VTNQGWGLGGRGTLKANGGAYVLESTPRKRKREKKGGKKEKLTAIKN